MKTIVIDRNSRLFRFAESWGAWKYQQKPDICAFRRALIWGVVKIALLYIGLLAVYGGMVFGLYSDFAKMELPVPLLLAALAIPAFGCVVALAILSLLGLTGFVSRKFEAWSDARAMRELEGKVKEPSALAQVYRSWKEKYCTKVEVK